MERTLISEIGSLEGIVTVLGWAQEIRILKNIAFLIVRDVTGQCQVTIKGKIDGVDIPSITRESVIQVKGKIVKNSQSKSGPEILATEITVLNNSLSPLPLAPFDPVNADIETRLNNRFLDLRKREHLAIFRIKSSLMFGIREFLHSQHFIEVQTPKIVSSATEGGADLFQVQYFDQKVYLNQSPQLYKEILISSGFDRVFEVGPAFRAEKHNTVIHLNEFTSVDIEMGFSNHEDAMAMLEGAVKSAIATMQKDNPQDLSVLNVKIEKYERQFPRITFNECLTLLEKEGVMHSANVDFSPEDLRIIGSNFDGFYFITKWPSSLRPFYTMPDETDPGITNSFDLQFKDKEVTSGAQRVHDPELLRKRFAAKELNPVDFDFYLKAFEFGMPPHAGWGLGLERLTMILLGLKNIRECTIFPRDRTRLKP